MQERDGVLMMALVLSLLVDALRHALQLTLRTRWVQMWYSANIVAKWLSINDTS